MTVLFLLIIGIIIQLWTTDQNIINEVKYGADLYKAEEVHCQWVTSLGMALNYGQNFNGTLDSTQCALRQFIYNEDNPSAEAARAGTAGKGSAVVAESIKELANQAQILKELTERFRRRKMK